MGCPFCTEEYPCDGCASEEDLEELEREDERRELLRKKVV